MNVATILVPTDFSSSAAEALKYASVIAHKFGASVLLTHVMPTDPVPGGDSDLYDPREPRIHDRLQSIHPTDSRVDHSHHMLHGVPAQEILQLADREHVDLIVMGARGQACVEGEPLGLVAREIVRKSKCPVFTLSQTEN